MQTIIWLVHHHGARDEGAEGNAELSSRVTGKARPRVRSIE
jgi:hypothetical protein